MPSRCPLLVLLAVFWAGMLAAAHGDEPLGDALARLVKAYPDFIDRIEGNELVWKDGTHMRIDDGQGAKAFEAMLERPDIKDMFAMTYPTGRQRPGARRQLRSGTGTLRAAFHENVRGLSDFQSRR